MEFALDATPLTVPTGGVRRYTEELSRALALGYPDDRFHLLSDQAFSFPGPKPSNLILQATLPQSKAMRRWWLAGLVWELHKRRCALFHGTDFSVPYVQAKPSVMTVHDLSPWLNRDWHSGAARVRKRTPILIRLGLATMFIVPSSAVARQVCERFNISADRIAVVPEAAATLFRPVPSAAPATPYFLYVGTLEPRKNLHTAINAWREIRRSATIDFVIAGRARADFASVQPEPGLILKGSVPDADLPRLYSGAVATLYPSLYEGFGLPVLEAMQCGSPVITTHDPAIEDVSGGAAIHVSATDGRAWADAMSAILASPERAAAMSEAGVRRAASFSWQKTASLTREVYSETMRRFRG